MEFIPQIYNDAKQFVKRHQTSIAATATGVTGAAVAYKLTSTHHLKVSNAFCYSTGVFAGMREARMLSLYKFIEEQGLLPEFEEFSKPLAELSDNLR